MARKSIKSDAVKLKGETAKKAPPLPAGADQPTNYAEQQGHGGETRQTTSDAALTMTTQQGIPIADAQNSLKAGLGAPRCSRTSSSAKRSSISITSASRSASSTHAAMARTACSS